MTTWADVSKGDRVVVKGRRYEVVKIKPKGKRATTRLRDERGTYDGEVKLKGAVQFAAAQELFDEHGAQRRWATPADATERRLEELLGAVLIGETDNETEGWYVPHVDVTTVAAHLRFFHDVQLLGGGVDDDLIALHDQLHQAAATTPFPPLHVAHTHSRYRPDVAA